MILFFMLYIYIYYCVGSIAATPIVAAIDPLLAVTFRCRRY
jgi:hypothetical protein